MDSSNETHLHTCSNIVMYSYTKYIGEIAYIVYVRWLRHL